MASIVEQRIVKQRIAILEPIFERSWELKRAACIAHRDRENRIKEKILEAIHKIVKQIYDGYEEVDRCVDRYDEYGPVYDISYKNGECLSEGFVNYAIPYGIVRCLLPRIHNGFLVDGKFYYLDTNNNLIYRILMAEISKITIDDIQLISAEEKQFRESFSQSCRTILKYVYDKMVRNHSCSYSGILIIGNRYYRTKDNYCPIDAGIAANLLKYFFVKEMSRRHRHTTNYLLSTTTDKIEKIETEHPTVRTEIVKILKQYPVEGSYILCTYEGMKRKEERIVYQM